MRIIFAGTPAFAAFSLKKLINAGHDVALVLTQPDRPSGRGMKLKPSEVKTVALEHNIPVLTPASLSVKKNPEQAEEALSALESADADVLVVAAYGLLLPERALNAARGIGQDGSIKSLNIHGSLLPRWRGAAPIQRAIEAGDKETGVCLMKMDKGLDTGAVISAHPTAISPEDTALTLTERLTEIGAQAVVSALENPASLTYRAQPESGVTYAEKLSKSESPLDWNQSAASIVNKIRAFYPFPGTTTTYRGTPFKIWLARRVDAHGRPGEILESKKRLIIACADGAIECEKAQKAGKPIMDIGPFLQSFPLEKEEVLA